MKQLQQLKYLFMPLWLLVVSFFVQSQPLLDNDAPKPPTGNTYAVVIGIASYLDTDIKPLQYSNRDAQVFADFLMSASGGSVPKQNIKLLLDAAATTGEVDNAILWLNNNCKAGDNVYFYFSGHGALENETMFQDGYLVCYNTPSTAFIRMGLSIDRLNKMAGTMSNKQANVIIITDACHSGRVGTSKFSGNLLVGQQLLNATEREVRMASCTPDQLSIEKADWGGGRGVFSYHLINGLQGGFADNDHNGTITTGEIKNYVEFKMANDSVLKRDNEVQTPVVKGRPDFQMSTVVTADAAGIQKMVAEDSMANVMLSVSMAAANDEANADPETLFFDLLKRENLEQLTVRSQLAKIPAEALPFVIIGYFTAGDITEVRYNKIRAFEQILKNDPQKLERFKIDLSRAFNDRGQEIILQYLKGDEAELEQRRYYNSNVNSFDVYVTMFEVAQKLAAGDQYLSTTSAVLKHYFSGVALRLKIRQTEKPDSLIAKAFAELNKALNLEEYAAYIYNELGILYEYKKDFAEAEKNYFKANQLSPGWALPYSNLCGLYAARGWFDKSMEACNTADSLKAGLLPVKVNQGYVSELKGNDLLADEIYHEAIEINDRHFAAFERLGFVNMNIADYAKADSFFYEAAERKKNYHFEANVWDPSDTRASIPGPEPGMTCQFEWHTLHPADVLGNFAQAMFEYNYIFDVDKARKYFETVLIIDPTNPLAYHYLGKIYFEQQNWEQAQRMLKLAIQYHLEDTAILKYADSLSSILSFPYDLSCFNDLFKAYQYPAEEDHFLLGAVYEAWKHIKDAAFHFKTGISINPRAIGGHAKLWNLYEREGRYPEAEEVIKKLSADNAEQSDRELQAFYVRMIEKFPDDAGWNYRLGSLLYGRASAASEVRYLDSIVWFPLLKEEIFIGTDYFTSIAADPQFAISGKTAPDEWGKFRLSYSDIFTRYPSAYLVPGSNEKIDAAGKILLPRKDGIDALTKAAELIADKGTLADIYFKIGNMYQWAGSKKQAYPYLEKSLSFNPDDANVRMSLIEMYRALHKNTIALKHLTYLYDSSQANAAYRLLLAAYTMQAGQFADADSLVNQLYATAPQENDEIEELERRLISLSKKTTDAIKVYKAYLATHAKDSMACYTLARLYAKSGNSNEAFKYLEAAVNGGFNYLFVLKNDRYLETIRKKEKWKELIKVVKPVMYNSPVMVN